MQLTEWMHPFFDRKTSRNRANPRIYPVDIFGYITMLRIFSLKKYPNEMSAVFHTVMPAADQPTNHLTGIRSSPARDGNNGADTRDHADDRQSAPMLCVDKFMAFTHE